MDAYYVDPQVMDRVIEQCEILDTHVTCLHCAERVTLIFEDFKYKTIECTCCKRDIDMPQ